jgi:hypothetical protein
MTASHVGLRIGHIILLAAPVFILPSDVTAQNKACELATPAELQAAVGAPVSGMTGQSIPGGSAEYCTGTSGTAKVMLRLARKASRAPGTEAKGIEMMRNMGAQIDVKTFGPITCSSMIPPKNMERYGYNTTCSVSKAGDVAAVEVTAKNQKDMVPLERLHDLAEKMAKRF